MTQLLVFTPTLNAAHIVDRLTDNLNTLSKYVDLIQYVGDGGSGDGTRAQIRARARYPVRIHTLEDQNIPETLNALGRIASQEHDGETLFTVLNADDVLNVPVFLPYMSRFAGDLTSGRVDVCSEDGRDLGQRSSTRTGLEAYMSINHLGLLARLSLLNEHPFPEHAPTSYDYVWIRHMLRANPDLDVRTWNDDTVGTAEFGGLSYRRRFAARREILADDLTHGQSLRGLTRYGTFLTKEAIRAALPQKAVDPLVRMLRTSTGSIDQWKL